MMTRVDVARPTERKKRMKGEVDSAAEEGEDAREDGKRRGLGRKVSGEEEEEEEEK